MDPKSQKAKWTYFQNWPKWLYGRTSIENCQIS
jgi:hypothetical protein